MTETNHRPLYVGNVHDDDAQIIDAFFEASPNGPSPLVEPVDLPAFPQPTIPTRLITGRQAIDASWSNATLLLPADIKRKRLRINANSSTATDGVTLMSDARTGNGLGILYAGQGVDLDCHTGPVFVTALSNNSEIINVDYWSVTE